MVFRQPDTVLNLYRNVPIADGLQAAFQSQAEQAAAFNALRVRQITAMTHINNTTGYVDISGDTRGVINCNYLSFNNVAFEGKPMYCSIDNADQIGNDTVRVFFTIDWWQTFMFDAKYRPSMILREHLNQAKHDLAVANPYRMDIPELLSDEELPTTTDLELIPNRGTGVITDNGLPFGSLKASGSIVPPRGQFPAYILPQSPLVKQFGSWGYSSAPNKPNPYSIVIKLATWDGIDKLITALQPISGNHLFMSPSYVNGFTRAFYLMSIYADNTDAGLAKMTSVMSKTLDWLTLNNLTSQILDISCVPLNMLAGDIARLGGVSGGSSVFPGMSWASDFNNFKDTHDMRVTKYETDIGFEPVSPKLYRSPFRTLRAISPNGTETNFPFENFGPTGEGFKCSFMLYNNFDDGPEQSLIPMAFNGHSLDYKSRLVFNSFPQVSYNIDGYLAYLGASFQAATLAETQGQSFERTTGISAAKTVLGAIPMTASGAAKNAISPGKVIDTTMDLRMRNGGEQLRNMDANGASATRHGDTSMGVLGNHKNALEADAYVAGNSAGSIGVRLNQNYWELLKVTLKVEVLKAYDDYFVMYGYKSGALGIPNIVDWVAGGELPWFGAHGTYVHTENLKVYGIYAPASVEIANLFNMGCRFTRGFS